MLTDIDLLDCPFCGSEVESFDTPHYYGYFYVHCETCEASGPYTLSREEAIEWWNHVSQQAKPKAKLDLTTSRVSLECP